VAVIQHYTLFDCRTFDSKINLRWSSERWKKLSYRRDSALVNKKLVFLGYTSVTDSVGKALTHTDM